MAVSPVKRKGLNEILAAMSAAWRGEPEQVPPGWYTVRELADARQCERSHACKIIQAALKAGTLEQRVFRIVTGRKVYPVAHYRAKNLRA